MAFKIREQVRADDAAVRLVIASAFNQNAEADLVEALIANGGVTLALVALQDDEIVGHILFSPLEIITDGVVSTAQALAPLAVAPAMQGRGVGGALIKASLAQLQADGHALVFVWGHPDYYTRFGFHPAIPHGYTSVYADGATARCRAQRRRRAALSPRICRNGIKQTGAFVSECAFLFVGAMGGLDR
jgi:putative acetyltransferase